MDNQIKHTLLESTPILSSPEQSESSSPWIPKPFPNTIKQIAIHNCSGVTKELVPALLSAIKSVHPKPWNIVLANGLEYDRDDVLYLIICPAGLGLNKVPMPMYYINWQLEYLNTNYANDNYIERMKGALANWDYSQFNINVSKIRDNIESIYVPPGFNETSSLPDIIQGNYIYTDRGKDIDVLFLGWCDPFPRRVHIRDNCVKAGLKVLFVCGLDDHEMKSVIRRSKICINIATTDRFIFHKIRMNILLSNQACIVSESTIDRLDNLQYEENGVCVVPLSQYYRNRLGVTTELRYKKKYGLTVLSMVP